MEKIFERMKYYSFFWRKDFNYYAFICNWGHPSALASAYCAVLGYV